jgi:hypothetical protein
MKFFHLFAFLLTGLFGYAQSDTVSLKRNYRFHFGSNGDYANDFQVFSSYDRWSSNPLDNPKIDSDYGPFSEVAWNLSSNYSGIFFGYSLPDESENHRSRHNVGVCLTFDPAFTGNLTAKNESRFTIDSVQSISTGQKFPVDSIITSSWNQKISTYLTDFGLYYTFDRQVGERGLVEMGLQVNYSFLREANVESSKSRELHYSVEGYRPEQTIYSATEDYSIDMKLNRFRIGIPVSMSILLNRPVITAKRADRFLFRNKKETKPVFIYLGYKLTPAYSFGKINGESFDRFNVAWGIKLKIGFN